MVNKIISLSVWGNNPRYIVGANRQYELAKKYYTVNPNDLYLLQQAITSKETTKEQTEYIKKTIQTGNKSTTGADTNVSQASSEDLFGKYKDLGFYLSNLPPSDYFLPWHKEI